MRRQEPVVFTWSDAALILLAGFILGALLLSGMSDEIDRAERARANGNYLVPEDGNGGDR